MIPNNKENSRRIHSKSKYALSNKNKSDKIWRYPLANYSILRLLRSSPKIVVPYNQSLLANVKYSTTNFLIS